MAHRHSSRISPSRTRGNGPPGSTASPRPRAPLDDDVIGGGWEDSSLVSLDFDDTDASRSWHDAEPDSPFDLSDRSERYSIRGARDAADLVDGLYDDAFDTDDRFDDIDDR